MLTLDNFHKNTAEDDTTITVGISRQKDSPNDFALGKKKK